MDWNVESEKSRSNFFRSVLIHGGWQITDENLVALVAWAQAEGGSGATTTGALNNPLNTTLDMRATGQSNFNSVPVRNYPDWSTGIDATVKTLQGDRYNPIINALAAGTSAEAIANAVVASPWGTSPLVRTLVPEVRANPRKFDIGVHSSANDHGDQGAAQGELVPGVPDIGNPLDAVGSFLSLLTSWSTWRRILLLLSGAALFVLGMVLMATDSPTIRSAATEAAVAAV